MTLSKNPVLLKKAPLISASFEIEFELYDNIDKLINDLSHSLRAQISISSIHNIQEKLSEDEKHILINLPKVKLIFDEFSVYISNKSIVISTKKYDGWENFKSNIIYIFDIIKNNHDIAIQTVYFKYIDFFEPDMLTVHLTLGNEPEIIENYSIRTQRRDKNVTHLIEIVSVTHKIDNKKGFLLDIGSRKKVKISIKHYDLSHFENDINFIHQSNKNIFFNMIDENKISLLEPRYE